MSQIFDITLGRWRPLTTADLAGGGGGNGGTSVTNLTATVSPTSVVVVSDTGTDATIPLADSANAGAMPPEAVAKLASLGTASTAAAGDFAPSGHTHTLLMTTDERTKLTALPAAADLSTSLAGKMPNTMTGLQTVINAGTPAEKAALQASVSVDPPRPLLSAMMCRPAPPAAPSGVWWPGVLLVDAYSGPLCTVRRSSDNATRDVYPLPGGMADVSAMIQWAGGAGLFFAAVYDQSGAGLHAVQATAGLQPAVVWSGIAGAHQSLSISATGTQSLTAPAVPIGTAGTIYSVLRPSSLQEISCVIGSAAGATGAGVGLSSNTSLTMQVSNGASSSTVSKFGAFTLYAASELFSVVANWTPAKLFMAKSGAVWNAYINDVTNAQAPSGTFGFSLPAVGYSGTTAGAVLYPRTLRRAESIALEIIAARCCGVRVYDSIIGNGDSLMNGQGASATSKNLMGLISAAVTAGGFSASVVNTGVGGATIGTIDRNQATIISEKVAYAGGRAVVICEGGTNNMAAGQSLADLQLEFASYVGKRKAAGAYAIATTIIARSDAGFPEAVRIAFNTWVRANWMYFADAIADTAADARLSDSTNLMYYQTDKTHLTDAGYQAMFEVVWPHVRRALVSIA